MTALATPGSAEPGWQRWLKRAGGAVFFCGVAFLLVREARGVAWPEVLAAARAYTGAQLLGAAGLAVASLTLYSCFDLLGRRYTALARYSDAAAAFRVLLTPLDAVTVVLQHVEGHARGRLHTHARQAPQRLDQDFKGTRIGHAGRSAAAASGARTGTSCRREDRACMP